MKATYDYIKGEVYLHKHKYEDIKNLDKFIAYIKENTEWQDSCKDYINDPPITECTNGDRYLIGDTPTSEWNEHADNIAKMEKYSSLRISAVISSGSNVITGISDLDLAKIQIGDRIYCKDDEGNNVTFDSVIAENYALVVSYIEETDNNSLIINADANIDGQIIEVIERWSYIEPSTMMSTMVDDDLNGYYIYYNNTWNYKLFGIELNPSTIGAVVNSSDEITEMEDEFRFPFMDHNDNVLKYIKGDNLRNALFEADVDDTFILTLGFLANEPETAEEDDTYYNTTSKKIFTYTTEWDEGVTPTENVIYSDIVNDLNYIWDGETMQQTSLGTIYIDPTTKKVGMKTTKPIEQLHVVGNTLLQKISTTVGQYIAHYFKISTNINNQCKKAAIAFERTDTYGRGKVHILVENTADYSNADLSDIALTVNPDKSIDITNNLRIGGIAIFSNNPTAWGNSGTTMTVTEVSTKINTLTLTDNCELTLPEFTDSVSFMIKVTQDATGGRSLTIKDSDANTMVNLSEMDFSTGTANQKCWITVLWDGTEGCYTTSKWCN